LTSHGWIPSNKKEPGTSRGQESEERGRSEKRSLGERGDSKEIGHLEKGHLEKRSLRERGHS